MVKGVFRYLLIISVLILIFAFETKAFSATLSDAYNALIGNGWTVKDALGFLGTSIAGTLAMNPSVAPAVAAGALSAYIGYKGAQLYDIYRDWRNLRMGMAMLNPVEYSQSMAVKRLRKGEYGWGYVYVGVSFYQGTSWNYSIGYVEYYNDNGRVINWWGKGPSGSAPKSVILQYINNWLTDYVPLWKDEQGKAIFTSIVSTAYNYLVADTAYSAYYGRQVVAALETGSVPGYDSTLGYAVNVDPMSISEDGVNYLSDPDAFYQWFLSNYMNGVNEGTFVTPLDSSYDEIRNDLQTIINQLNNLSSAGGVSSETLEQFKTDIINALSAVNETSESNILNELNAKFGGLESALTGVNTNLNTLQSDISSVKTSVDTVITDINEAQEQEQGFWDGLMGWLNETLWTKLEEFVVSMYRLLVVPEEAAQIWDITVAGWMDMVSWDDLEMPAFSLSGDTLGTYNIPLGNGSIPLKIGDYVAQTGLRGLVTGIIIFSMWFGFLLKLLPRFNI